MTETIIKSEKIYSGKILSVKVNTVELPDQKYSKREIVLHDPAVCIVAKNKEKIILVKQYRISVDKEILEIPAGMIEPGEAPKEAAIRELREETGYESKNIEYVTEFYSSPGYSSEKIYLFYADNLELKEQNLDEEEQIEVLEVSIDEALKMIEVGDIMDSKTIAGILLYKNFKEKKDVKNE